MSPTRSFSGIRRNRQSYSCESCRSRRVKCDQARPQCGTCTRSGTHCTYPSLHLKRKSSTDDFRHRLEGEQSKRKTAYSPPHIPCGHLTMEAGGRSRYTSNTFWASVDEESLELDSLLSDLPLFPAESVHPSSDNEQTNIWATQEYSSHESSNLSDTLAKLPPKTTCDRLYSSFLGGVHPLIPLVHLPALDSQYGRFWEWYEGWDRHSLPQGVLAENPSFLPLLMAVLFCGSIASAKVPGVNSRSQLRELQTTLYNLASETLTMVGFPHSPSLYSLMGFLLLQSLLILEEESLASISFITLAYRVCQAMGLHEDGTNFNLDPVLVEERRRVWFYVLHLDVMTSMISGLPPIANPELTNSTYTMSELRDEYIGSKEWQLNDEDVDTTLYYPGYILAAGRYDASHCIRKILHRQSESLPLTFAAIESSKEMLSKLRHRAESRIKKLSLISDQQRWPREPTKEESSRHPSPPLSTFTSDSLDTWAKDLLQLTVEKGYCMLYQPLMKDTQIWPQLRNEAIAHFQIWLQTFLKMCSTKSYSPFQWLYPGAYQPLQASAVLLIDLMKEPTSEQALESRNLLERVFSLLGDDGRIGTGAPDGFAFLRQGSKGAKAAWMRLEKLRKKVWKSLGLDADMLWAKAISENRDEDDSLAGEISSPEDMHHSAQFDPTGQATTHETIVHEISPLQSFGFDLADANFSQQPPSSAAGTDMSPIADIQGLFASDIPATYSGVFAQSDQAWFGLQEGSAEFSSDMIVGSGSASPNVLGWAQPNE